MLFGSILFICLHSVVAVLYGDELPKFLRMFNLEWLFQQLCHDAPNQQMYFLLK